MTPLNSATDPSRILKLNAEEEVDRGTERRIFVHPDEPKLLIKISRVRPAAEYTRFTFGDLTKRFFPSVRLRSVIKQYDEFNRLTLKGSAPFERPLPISHFFGFVPTNLGWGGLTERVVDAQGENGPTLSALLKSGEFTDEQLVSLNQLMGRLYELGVCVSDLNAGNFVFGHRFVGALGDRTAPEWVLVDGFGDRFAVTLRSINDATRRLSIDEAFKRAKLPAGIRWNGKQRRFEKTT